MIAAKFLLKNKIDNLPASKRRDFLITCIKKNGLLKLLEEEEETSDDSPVDLNLFCKVCNTYDFIRYNYSETCNKCGTERLIQPSGRVYEKIEYIKPGENIVKIVKDGKEIKVNLNKINQWLQDTDPLATDTQKILDNLELIFNTKGIEVPSIVKNTSVALWYNFNLLRKEKSYNKKAILVLCVYYGATMHGYIISLEQLSKIFNVLLPTIFTANTLFKEIFKSTEYYKNLNLQEKKTCNVNLTPKNKLLLEHIKKDLIKNFKISDPLDNVYYAAIVYYITNKINPAIKFTLNELSSACNISTTNISRYSKSIENFYNKNPKFKKLLVN